MALWLIGEVLHDTNIWKQYLKANGAIIQLWIPEDGVKRQWYCKPFLHNTKIYILFFLKSEDSVK